MRAIPSALLAHYQGSTLTLATLWKITRQDGTIFGFTDIDEDVEYAYVTYLAGTGITPSATDTAASFGVDNLEVQSVLRSDTITEQDLKIGLWDGAKVELFQVNFNDLSQGHSTIKTGYLGEVRNGRLAFSAELRGLSQRLQTSVGRIYSPACDATLGDSRCTVDLEPLKISSTVTAPYTQTSFQDSARTEADGWFNNGLVVFTSGQNAGFKAEVVTYSAPLKLFSLYVQLPYPTAVGDTYESFPGCDKKLSTCKSKFDNRLNFRGFPTIPGPDLLLSGQTVAPEETP